MTTADVEALLNPPPPHLKVNHAPVLVDGTFVYPCDDRGPVSLLHPRYVEALGGEHSIDDPVTLEHPLLAGIPPERLHVRLGPLGAALYGVVVEHGPDTAHIVYIPQLVGGVLHLTIKHTKLGAGPGIVTHYIQYFAIHIAHQ